MKALPRLPVGEARIGIVLGSGLGNFADSLENTVRTPYSKIPGLPVAGVEGHAGELVVGTSGGVPVAVLSGRAHFYEGYPMASVVAGVRALARSGIRAAILTNAAGAIRRSFRPGDLMLISDHINGFGTSPLIGGNEEQPGARFPDMSEAYDAAFRRIARSAARRLRIPIREGVYVGLHGPSYETPAEIRMWARAGADAVGMSTVPEVIALRQMSVRVLGLSILTNMAAGILTRSIEHHEVLDTGRRVAVRLRSLIESLLTEIDAAVRKP